MSAAGAGTGSGPTKRNSITWTEAMLERLLYALLEQKRAGRSSDAGWKKETYAAVLPQVQAATGQTLSSGQVRSKVSELKQAFRAWAALRAAPAIGWDPVRRTHACDLDTWAGYVAAHPRARQFRERPLKWPDVQEEIFGDDAAIIPAPAAATVGAETGAGHGQGDAAGGAGGAGALDADDLIFDLPPLMSAAAAAALNRFARSALTPTSTATTANSAGQKRKRGVAAAATTTTTTMAPGEIAAGFRALTEVVVRLAESRQARSAEEIDAARRERDLVEAIKLIQVDWEGQGEEEDDDDDEDEDEEDEEEEERTEQELLEAITLLQKGSNALTYRTIKRRRRRVDWIRSVWKAENGGYCKILR